MIRLERIINDPILKAKKENKWEAGAVFNCGIIQSNGLIHMLYRATNKNSNGKKCSDYLSYLGYAVSVDGVNFSRLDTPILGPTKGQEQRGVEDPRIVKFNDTYYMLYTGFGGRFSGDYRISLATSNNLIKWEKKGVVLKDANKDASYFSEKINGKYYMLHRRSPNIWITESHNLKTWTNHKVILKPLKENEWENYKIGLGGPPIKTEFGWVIIYHGVSKEQKNNCGNGTYSLGVAILDKDDPSKVIFRQNKPILEPELDWEINGFVKNVVFSNGHTVINNELYVYYGAADTAIGVAKVSLQDIKSKIL